MNKTIMINGKEAAKGTVYSKGLVEDEYNQLLMMPEAKGDLFRAKVYLNEGIHHNINEVELRIKENDILPIDLYQLKEYLSKDDIRVIGKYLDGLSTNDVVTELVIKKGNPGGYGFVEPVKHSPGIKVTYVLHS